MHLGHRKTRKSFDKEGDAHFLTFSCYRRLPLLTKERTCLWVIEAIDKSKQKNPFDLWVWVIMPEHVHLVLLPHENIRIAAILSTMKLSISKRAITWTKCHAPKFLDNLLVSKSSDKKSYRFWQRGGGYDRNLRTTRDVHEKIRYVHQNPVKRGLVETAEAWPWSSAKDWEDGTDSVLMIDRESVPMLTNLDDHVDSELFS